MKRFSPWLNIILATTALCCLAATGVRAQENTETKAEVKEEKAEAKAEEVDVVKEKFAKDKTGTNPMNFTFDARLYNEYQWLNTTGDGHQNITTAEFRAPFAGGKWQFRAKVRGVNLKADFTGNGIADVDESGFGDTDVRVMAIPYMSLEKKLAVAVGVEFFLDTASEPALGSGANTVAPLVFLGFFNPIGPGSIFVPGYQHKYSVDENDGRAKVRQGLIDMFLVKTWNENQYWGYIDPQILLDYENNKEFMLFEMQAGMMLYKKGHSTWVMPSIGVGTDRPYDVSLEIGYKIVW